MKSYQLGNNMKCTIRSYNAGKIGTKNMSYGNQPYTVIPSIEGRLTFESINAQGTSKFTDLVYNTSSISTVTLSEVPITDKILNLIFPKSEALLCNESKNYISDDENKIYLTFPSEKIYQVFIYDDEGNLEAAYGELSNNVIEVLKDESEYLIFYSYLGNKGYSLDDVNNFYLTLDLELIGNIEEETTSAWIHIDKCGLQPVKDLDFSRNLNSVDLTFQVIKTNNDYISFAN